ncbi:lipoprotein [Pseudomonas cichorii]|nr:lipoprotein [Pseudomonas cichorii]
MDREPDMKSKSLIACLALLGCASIATLPAQAVQTVEASGNTHREIEVGSFVPERFLNTKAAMTDWKTKGLTAPGVSSQWVRIQDKYARVQVSNGKVVEVVQAPN